MRRHWGIIGLVVALGLGIFSGQVASPERVQAAAKTYTIAMDTTFPPFEFADKNNKRVGIDIDLIRAIAKAEGFKVSLKATSFNGAVQELQANQVDGVMAGMSITPERKKVFAFSDPLLPIRGRDGGG